METNDNVEVLDLSTAPKPEDDVGQVKVHKHKMDTRTRDLKKVMGIYGREIVLAPCSIHPSCGISSVSHTSVVLLCDESRRGGGAGENFQQFVKILFTWQCFAVE